MSPCLIGIKDEEGMKEGKEISVYRFKCVKRDTVAEKGNMEEFLF